MNIEITGRHVLATPAIQSYVHKRLRRFAKLLGEEANFHVILGVEKDRHTAEIILKSKLLRLTGRGETKDMYSSILLAIEKLEKQAVKRKTRIIEGKRHFVKGKPLAGRLPSPILHSAPVKLRQNGIHVEETGEKPMAVEEAVLELDLSEYSFFVFRNVESGSVNVLYKRKDGSLGLIYS